MTQPLPEPLPGPLPLPSSVPSHPVLAAVAAVEGALDSVALVNPTFMRTTDKAAAMVGIVRLECRLAELKLRVLAEAEDVAHDAASRDPAGWIAHATRTDPAGAKADAALAVELERRPLVAAGLRAGGVTVDQARVVVKALAALDAHVDAETVTAAEEHLVGLAAEFGPRQLATLAGKVLQVVAPEIADEVDARRLAALESDPAKRTTLRLRRRGDGWVALSGAVPPHVGTRLAVYLEAHTNPRQRDVFGREHAPEGLTTLDGASPETASAARSATAGGRQVVDPADPVARLPHATRLGQAFCALLEDLDPTRLPIHGGDATTLMVTITLDDLRRELATADLLTTATIPGQRDGEHSIAADRISAAQVRRLACTAKIIPVVLGGKGEILDLGRSRRLFSAAQRKALLLRDRTCRAEGCDIPGTWAEAHHWTLPWGRGGRSDLDDGLLLCSHHHHRAHEEDRFTTERLPNGDLRFHPRR